MPNLLYIEASPRGASSHSSGAAHTYLQALRRLIPDLAVDPVDLWREDFPDLDGDLLNAKYARLAGTPLAARQASAWAKVEQMIDRIARSDLILISTPMWNMGIPYRLKHYIDLITQPGLSFRFDPANGYTPLLASRPVTIILATSGDFSNGPSWGRPDLASPYLREALKFIGLTDTNFVLVGPTIGPAAMVKEARTRAEDQLIGIAKQVSTLRQSSAAA